MQCTYLTLSTLPFPHNPPITKWLLKHDPPMVNLISQFEK